MSPAPQPAVAPGPRRGVGAMLLALTLGAAGLLPAWPLELPAAAAATLAPFALLLVGGVCSGWLAGLLGIGGALVTLPALYVALPELGVAPTQVGATAVATALATMVPTTLMATWRQHTRGALDLRWLRRLVPSMTLGAALGAFAAGRVDGVLLGLAFALQSVWYGGCLLREAEDEAARRPSRLPASPHWLAGTLIASFCACVGMGCGSLLPRYLQRRGVAFRHAVATGSALNLCIALGGSAAFAIAGRGGAAHASTCWPAALLLGLGAVAAAPFGVAFAHRIPVSALRRAVAAVNIFAAVALAVQLAR